MMRLEKRNKDLKSCPFCGGDAHFVKVGNKVSVRCKSTECENHTALYSHWSIAACRWNRRVQCDT